jgi:GH24 family phage-related lysozyme (muramidase)
MDIINTAMNAISDFMGGGKTEPEPTVREQVVQPLRQPINDEPVAASDEPLPESFNEMRPMSMTEFDTDIDTGKPEDFDLATDDEKLRAMYDKDLEDRKAITGIKEDDTKLVSTEEQARSAHLENIKTLENQFNEGLVKEEMSEKFMPFDSDEGTGPDSGMSKQEIGYGIKIPKSWLTKDKRSWPSIDGVKVDISKGITKEQAESLSKKALGKAYDSAKTKLTKWSDMTEKEKSYWADLTYNGGARAINKNPKARAVANAGHTAEAMVLSLDYIKSAGKVSRGLLNRRLSMYNQAALEITGAPIIEEYVFGKDIKVKFSSNFMTDKVSKAFSKKIKKNKLWFVVAHGGDSDKSWKVDSNFKF